jgi:hypothetical protein
MSDSAYRKMLEGKITSKKYAQELKKQVRRDRNASTGRYVSSNTPRRETSA